jgi:NADPH:quinone reductase-like Zn-dependent oxidoreductase
VKAARFHEHGGPEVLRYENAPDPVLPGPGWALVRVHACALNHLDIWQRRGLDRVKIPLPHISGADVSGEVVDLSGPSSGSTGGRVMLQPGISCGECAACLAGFDNRCPRYDVLGYQSDGGYAEFVAVPVENLIPIPYHIDFATAAAFPLTFLTAWHMLVTLAGVKSGDTVLVIAAGSGVGQAALQIAKHCGARVIATAGGDDKLAKALAAGATDAIDHYRQDVTSEVRRITSNRGVDIVVEHVGIATFAKSVKSLAVGGRLVTCGATTGYDARLDLRLLFAKQLQILGSYMGTKRELIAASKLLFDGTFRPVIDREVALADVASAHRALESSETYGKVVLRP